MRDYREIAMWRNISADQWADWRWHMQNVVTSLAELEQIVELSDEERAGVRDATQYLRMRIPPHVATLMHPHEQSDPLRLQFIPSVKELASISDNALFSDVNADDRYSPTKGLVHRYPSKALLLTTNYCGAYCRYCFRRKLVREVEDSMRRSELEAAFEYIFRTPQIEEVILSGGDPLVLSDEVLQFILSSLAQIPHVQMMRLHTRLPVTIPFRITAALVSILARYKPIYMVIHIDTVREISDPMREAVARLVDNGIPCFASCPLLKGINDSESELRTLWTELLKIRVKPYYLFHSDPVRGLRHFLVPMTRGLEIMRNLYDRMSGLALPHYCLNVPDGGGHVLLNPSYVRMQDDGRWLITTFEGDTVEYFENAETA